MSVLSEGMAEDDGEEEKEEGPSAAALFSTPSSSPEWMGRSDVRPMTVSAATMPPMEWPASTTRTEGSTRGGDVGAQLLREAVLVAESVVAPLVEIVRT
ncbi:hypothetical protein ColKHC_03820 [Colletotrichum higginsianum]|nr:hypothetical protein ColKHC_03820 [Colletotrichum higginsianum]